MPLVISNALLVRLIWNRAGVGFAINVLGATGVNAAGVNQALANTLGAAIKGHASTTALMSVIHPTVTLANVGVRSVSSESQPEFLDAGAAVTGTGTGNMLPPQVAIAVTLRTALAGKEYRGRVYLPGFSAAASDANGQAVAGATSAAVNFITGVQAALTSSALTHAVLSRKLNQANPVTLVLSRNSIFETQRRRAIPGI